MTTAVRTFWGELQHKVGRLAIDVLADRVARARPVERVLADPVLGRHRRRHQGHPEEHHRRARAGAPSMNFVLTAEQLGVGAVAAKLLDQELPLPRVRELAELASPGPPRSRSTRHLAPSAPSWAGSHSASRRRSAGSGAARSRRCMLFTELGRHLAPGPFASTVVAGWVAAAAGSRELADETSSTAGAGPASWWGTSCSTPSRAASSCASRERPASSFEVRPLDRGRERRPLGSALHASRRATWSRARTTRCCSRAAQLLVSAMELGIADAVLDMSVDYAKFRHPVRQADRHVPGGEAPLLGHGDPRPRRARPDPLRRVPRRGQGRRRRLPGGGRQDDRDEGREAQHRRQRPEPRRDRLHRGARRRALRAPGAHARVRARRGARGHARRCSRSTGTASRRCRRPSRTGSATVEA